MIAKRDFGSKMLVLTAVVAIAVTCVHRKAIAVPNKVCGGDPATCIEADSCGNPSGQCSGNDYDCAEYRQHFHSVCRTSPNDNCTIATNQICGHVLYYDVGPGCSGITCINKSGPPDCTVNATEEGCTTGGGGGM